MSKPVDWVLPKKVHRGVEVPNSELLCRCEQCQADPCKTGSTYGVLPGPVTDIEGTEPTATRNYIVFRYVAECERGSDGYPCYVCGLPRSMMLCYVCCRNLCHDCHREGGHGSARHECNIPRSYHAASVRKN